MSNLHQACQISPKTWNNDAERLQQATGALCGTLTQYYSPNDGKMTGFPSPTLTQSYGTEILGENETITME